MSMYLVNPYSYPTATPEELYNQSTTGSDVDSDYSRYHGQSFASPNTEVTGEITKLQFKMKKTGSPSFTFIGVYYPNGDITSPTYTNTSRNVSSLDTSFGSFIDFEFDSPPTFENGDYLGIEFGATGDGTNHASIQSSGYISAPVTGAESGKYWDGDSWEPEACNASSQCRYMVMTITGIN